MNNRKFIIFYNETPIVEITDLPELYNPTKILDAYSDFSGFEKNKLTYCIINNVRYNELRIW